MAAPVSTFFDADGKPLAGEALDKAWASGSAHVAADTQLHMLDANGDLRLVPADRVAAARAKGYAPAPAEVVEQDELQKAHGGIGGQAATVAESAADMATLGGYGFAAGKLAPSYAKNLLARREANPISHVAGSVVGLAPSLLDGGAEVEGAELGAKATEAAAGEQAAHAAAEAPGMARQALGAANSVAAAPLKAVGALGGIVERGVARGLASLGADGSTLAGRVGAKALKSGAAGAAEGAVFGVGSALSDSSLEGKDLTSEALVSSIGRNALFGGGLGAGMGAISELGGAAIKGLLPDSEKLAKFGREQGLRSIGANGKDIQKLGGKLDMTADELMGYEFKTGENAGQRMFSAASNAKEMAENLAQASSETGAAKRGIVQEIDQAIQTNPQVAAVAQPDMGELFNRIDTQVLEKLRKSDVMADRRLVKTIEREYAPLRADWEAAQGLPANDGATLSPVDRVNQLGVENAEFNRDPESMRDMRVHRGGYEGASPEDAASIARGERSTMNSSGPFEPVKVNIEADGQIHLNDGRHRLQAAQEAGASEIAAHIRTFDADGNLVSEVTGPVSLKPKGGALPPRPITFARLDEFEQRLGKRIYGENVKGAGIQVAPKGAKQLERVRGILSDFQDENAQKALAAMGEDSAAYATLNRQYSTLSNLKKIADRTAGRMDANRMASPTDHALGMGGMILSMLSGGTGALGAMAYGGAAAVANKLLRERGNSVLADIAYRTSKMDHLLENTAHALSVSPERLAQPIEAVGEIAHHKAREELAESNYVPLGLKALHKDFDETSTRVQAMADPVAAQAQLTVATGPIAQHYPEQASAMAGKLQGIYQHLNATLPAAHGGSVTSPLAVQPRVSPREQMRFLSRVNAALNPAQVIRDIGDGKLDKDALDTLKAVYPATYAQLQQKTMTLLAASKTQMPFQRTIHIGQVLGIPSDSSLGPRLAGIQQSIQQIGGPAPKAPGAPGPTKRGNPGVSKLGTSFNLPGQAAPGAK